MVRFRTGVALCIVLLLSAGCTQHQPSAAATSLPIAERGFFIGMVPTPREGTGFEGLAAAYEEAGRIGEIAMVWIEPPGIGQYERLQRNRVITAVRVYGMRPVVILTFADLTTVSGAGLAYTADLDNETFRQAWIAEARSIAAEFHPAYLALGNEINDYLFLHPEHRAPAMAMIADASREIQEVSPDTRVMVIFSYNHLIDNNQWELLSAFSPHADVIGLTTYPERHVAAPAAIPDDYYRRISAYTSLPIAFTEIGWSREDEQAAFLRRFLACTDGMNLEMVNWLFLHEMELSGMLAAAAGADTGKIALKHADGTPKEVYDVWLELYSLPRTG